MEQRLSVVTLGVNDLGRAQAFYEALGWVTRAAPGDDVVFFQAGGVFVDLDGHPWEVAHNPRWGIEDDATLLGA